MDNNVKVWRSHCIKLTMAMSVGLKKGQGENTSVHTMLL